LFTNDNIKQLVNNLLKIVNASLNHTVSLQLAIKQVDDKVLLNRRL